MHPQLPICFYSLTILIPDSQELPSGTLTTVEGFEPKINAKIEFGADWMYLDPDGATARINIKSIAKLVQPLAPRLGNLH